MRDDVRDAIESACSVGVEGGKRRVGFTTMKFRLLEIIRGLPEDMTVQELRQEIEE